MLKIRQICIDTLDKVDFPMPLFGKAGIGEIFFFTNGSIVTVIKCSVGNEERPLSMGQILAAADSPTKTGMPARTALMISGRDPWQTNLKQ